MDTRRLILFIVLSIGLMLGWQKLFPAKEAPVTTSQTATSSAPTAAVASDNQLKDSSSNLDADKVINVTTDLMKVQISTVGGDIRDLGLLKYSSYESSGEPYQILLNKNNQIGRAHV